MLQRVDELTLRWLDGTLSAAEEAELAALLQQDAEARRRYVALLRLEAALRGRGQPVSVAEATVAYLHAQAQADLEKDVMQAIALLPSPGWSRSSDPQRRRSVRWWAWAAGWGGLALAAVLGVSLGVRTVSRPGSASGGASDAVSSSAVSSAPPLAWLTELEEQAWLGDRPAAVGQVLAAGQVLHTLDEGRATVQLANGSRLELAPRSRLCWRPSSTARSEVYLQEGVLQAEVPDPPADPPLVIATPHAQLRITGTRLWVTASAEMGTRIDLESGRAELSRPPTDSLTLEAGWTAYIPPDQPPRIAPSAAPLAQEPAHFLELRGIKTVGFDPQQLQALAATNTHVVYWQPERSELLPVRLVGRGVRDKIQGFRIQAQAGAMLGLIDDRQQRWVIWDARSRSERWSQPKLSPGGDILAVSPRGDWIALRPPGSPGRHFWLWPTPAPKPLEIAGPSKVVSVTPAPDGRTLAVLWLAGTVEIIDAATGQRCAPPLRPRSKTFAAAFSPDGQHLALAQNGQVEVYHLTTGQGHIVLKQPGLPLLHTALAPDGQRGLAASYDDRIWLWTADQPDSPRLLFAPGSICKLALAPDGRHLVVCTKHQNLTPLSWWYLTW
jgi:hypothetical protein